jgi:hypothetical protein
VAKSGEQVTCSEGCGKKLSRWKSRTRTHDLQRQIEVEKTLRDRIAKLEEELWEATHNKREKHRKWKAAYIALTELGITF